MNAIINNLASSLRPSRTNLDVAVVDQQKAVSSASVDLIATPLNGATDIVLWTVMVDAIVVTFDGSTPTATNGHEIGAGTSGEWSKKTAESAKAIRKTTDARVHFSEFQTQ